MTYSRRNNRCHQLVKLQKGLLRDVIPYVLVLVLVLTVITPLPNMTGGNPPSLSTKSCTEDVIGAHKMFIYFRLNCLYIYIQSHKDALF